MNPGKVCREPRIIGIHPAKTAQHLHARLIEITQMLMPARHDLLQHLTAAILIHGCNQIRVNGIAFLTDALFNGVGVGFCDGTSIETQAGLWDLRFKVSIFLPLTLQLKMYIS